MGKLINKNKKKEPAMQVNMPILVIPHEGTELVINSNVSESCLFNIAGEKVYLGCTKSVEKELGVEAIRSYLIKYIDSSLFKSQRYLIQSNVINVVPLENGMKVVTAPQGKEIIVALCDSNYQIKWNLK